MSILLFGVSHLTAPVSVLERIAIADTDRPKVLARLLEQPGIEEAMVVATCNRVEVYAVVEAFHPGLEAIGQVIGDHSGLAINELTRHAFVRYSEAAVQHLFTVASGLDSMVVGEQQILGQIRTAYAEADAASAAGSTIHDLAQRGLKVGKRVHTETDIDAAGASMVSVALDRALAVRAAAADPAPIRRAVVIGAGAMGSLAVSTLARAGIADIVVLNRTADKAARLAETATTLGAPSVASGGLDELDRVLADADVAITCTGAIGGVIDLPVAHRALAARRAPGELVICDLGLPRDVDPAVRALPNLSVIDLETLAGDPAHAITQVDANKAREFVAEELADYLSAQRRAEVTPTVTALRQRAAEVVEAELLRLEGRLPDLADPERAEVAQTVRRVVDKLLHAPTVRVKQLAASGEGESYAEALRELFELKPGATQAVSGVEPDRKTIIS